jgi:hypothetical protein
MMRLKTAVLLLNRFKSIAPRLFKYSKKPKMQSRLKKQCLMKRVILLNPQ